MIFCLHGPMTVLIGLTSIVSNAFNMELIIGCVSVLTEIVILDIASSKTIVNPVAVSQFP